MSKLKYVCSFEYFPNCRGCDGGYYGGLQFFKSFRELLVWALENKNYYEIQDIYNLSGKYIGDITYELSSHSCSGLRMKLKYLKLRTYDNGNGKLEWGII